MLERPPGDPFFTSFGKVQKPPEHYTAELLFACGNNIHLFVGRHSSIICQPDEGVSMSIQLGQIAPDFEQDSTQGRIRFHEWLGDSWGLFLSHPKNFTPVCTKELGEVAGLRPDWDKRNVKPIGLSIDPVEAPPKWDADIKEAQGQMVDFRLIKIGQACGREDEGTYG